MHIRYIAEGDRQDWVRMRDALWPGALSDHDAETVRYFADGGDTTVVFVAEEDRHLVGFLELDFRKYAPGCSSSPVPFVEGWYVEAAHQGRGVGRALMAAAEAHARSHGYTEIASDTDIERSGSIAAHRALGFEEVERVVVFRRSLK